MKECEMAMLYAYSVQLPDPLFESLHTDSDKTIGSYLEHANSVLPLVKVCRRIASERLCEIIPPKERILELEQAWAEIPCSLKLQAHSSATLQKCPRLHNIRKDFI